MLYIEGINHIGIRISDKMRSIEFYKALGFEYTTDTGFEEGHPIVMRHPSGVVINLLGPSNQSETENILMDVADKHTGITHFALTISDLKQAKEYFSENNIELTGSFSFDGMSAVFIRDPDRNVIEFDAFDTNDSKDASGYVHHP